MIRPRIGIYILIALFAACGFVDDADQAESGDIVSAEDLDAFPMREGDCFDDSLDTSQAQSVRTGRGGLAEEIAAIPCSEPHDNELYAVFDLSDRLPYLALERFPGEEGIVSFSRDGCFERFENFIGISYEESTLLVRMLYPTAESWAQGDREVSCMVYHSEEKLAGSMRGSGI